MKRLLLPILMLGFSNQAFAQQDFFALTGKNGNAIVFNDFRALDLENGVSGATIFSAESTPRVFSDVRNMNVSEEKSGFNQSQSPSMASLAFDQKNNQLFFMPMFSSNIYAMDLQSKNIVLIENMVAKTTPCDINSHFTRMTAGYDGNIYVTNNAATQFLKIEKKRGKYVVSDLGAISDDESNGKNSINQMSTGFGGDMIADAENNFYIFSASGNVFKIATQTRKATFIGAISGLPNNYSVNGAAVDSKGNVVIANALGGSLHSVNLETLQANPIAQNINLHVYDLASKYFANDQRLIATATGVEIYPTKISDQTVNISINDKNVKGNVAVEIYDMSGKNVMKQSLTNSRNKVEKISLKSLNQGVYLVNVTDESGKILVSKKVLIAN